MYSARYKYNHSLLIISSRPNMHVFVLVLRTDPVNWDQSRPNFSPVNSTIWSIPSYTSTSKPYFSLTSGGTNLPPRNCRPLKCWVQGLGAVSEIKACGWNPSPGPDVGGPSSTSHDEGMSTAKTGTDVLFSAKQSDRIAH
jgi:hypothetical protein